ncbi:MAG: DUF2167 domain-containing protein [Planctomycetes bacterium]|nr:DUF2167 domain-containing protein [Planctomycetota bacterium]
MTPTQLHRGARAALLSIGLAVAAALPATAQDAEPGTTWSQHFRSLDPQTGRVTVQGGKATIDVPDGWHYLQQRGARNIVEEVWGNPPNPDTLGLLTPPGFESDAEGTPTWAIIVSYDDEGHHDDSDAGSIDYDELLKAMQEATRNGNAARRKAGYEELELVGWAERPHYDSAGRKLYWAKHLRFESGESLNYDIRILGRRGTLVLQAVAGMPELGEVREATQQLLPAVSFVQGERYEDYQEGVDPLVAGGIGVLIGGKLLAKGGLLKVLAGLWKPIALGLAALGAFVARLLGRRKSAQEPTASA